MKVIIRRRVVTEALTDGIHEFGEIEMVKLSELQGHEQGVVVDLSPGRVEAYEAVIRRYKALQRSLKVLLDRATESQVVGVGSMSIDEFENQRRNGVVRPSNLEGHEED